MPIYHFNLVDHRRDPDVDGTELADIDAARNEAIAFAGDYLSDNPALLDNGAKFGVEVTDDNGQALFTVLIQVVEPS